MQELECEDKGQSQSRNQGPELKQDREKGLSWADHTEIAEHSDTTKATVKKHFEVWSLFLAIWCLKLSQCLMRRSGPAKGLLLIEALASRNRSLRSVWVESHC